LKKRLSTYIPDPEVNVRLISAAGNKIYVTGEVKRPGAFEAARPMDVMQAISMAEGLTEFAKRNGIIVLRRDAEGRVKSFSFEYDEVESGEQLESNIVLQAGDTVVVP
jgi:polysaccharide export outer membrane protein